MRKIISSLIFVCCFLLSNGQLINFDYLDYNLPTEERVDILISQMTLKEKVSQMKYDSPAIPRLGVPAYNWWNESLHGVARAGYATVFPQSITIAASWDRKLINCVATAISDEGRAKYHDFLRKGKRGIYQGLTFWSPNINIFRDPRWGRGHETYGEDPYLTGELGVEFVKGLQGNDPKYLKTVATAKHYAVHSGPEPIRHEFNAKVSERDLRETYLPAFRKLVKEGKVYSIMGAYNQFRDYPCCANPYLNNILRGEWNFNGYVVSDCWAISDFYKHQDFSKGPAEAAAIAVKYGTDLNCGVAYRKLDEAVEKDFISEQEIDVALKRLFTARFNLGMFDPDEIVPYAQIPYSKNCSKENALLALEAARKSIVLLKNENNILPLSKNIKKLAVIGPNADNWEALLGNYNGIPKKSVTVLSGLKNKFRNTEILYTEGCHMAKGVSNLHPIPKEYLFTEDGQQGVIGEYFNNDSLSGKPIFSRIDKNIDFYWESNAPSPVLPDDNFSVRWTGYIVPPVSGEYSIGCWGMPTLDIWFEGKKILKHNVVHHAFHHEKMVKLQAGKRYKFVYEYKNWHGDGDAKLKWALPNDNMEKEAVDIAKQSDAVILVLGLSQRLEGEEMPIQIDGFEGGDRTHLMLPKIQRNLMTAITKTGKPVIVVLLNGSALAINDTEKMADAILTAGYPGQEGGNAIAEVLSGEYNPAGRLPITYYKSVKQLPPFEDYSMKNRTYRYFYDEPLYSFGYGLSYTTFKYTNLKISSRVKAGESVKVKVDVTNAGDKKGEEVVQLYIKDEKASTIRPRHQLEGFKRITLNPQQTKTVEFNLTPRQFSMINKDEKRVIEPGWFTIYVGGGQPNAKGAVTVSNRVKLTGEEVTVE